METSLHWLQRFAVSNLKSTIQYNWLHLTHSLQTVVQLQVARRNLVLFKDEPWKNFGSFSSLHWLWIWASRKTVPKNYNETALSQNWFFEISQNANQVTENENSVYASYTATVWQNGKSRKISEFFLTLLDMIGQKNFIENVCTRFIKVPKKQKYNSLIDPAF